ncbi:hypothetical protein T484DRAFT_1755548 [Baffinella frigidus]|nr:hypothetical protein T484DRAFT_1755548 [Cryptophyta sp. CCMP2293]
MADMSDIRANTLVRARLRALQERPESEEDTASEDTAPTDSIRAFVDGRMMTADEWGKHIVAPAAITAPEDTTTMTDTPAKVAKDVFCNGTLFLAGISDRMGDAAKTETELRLGAEGFPSAKRVCTRSPSAKYVPTEERVATYAATTKS